MANYMERSVDKAKTELIRIFYGRKPSVQIPFLLKLCAEVQQAATALLSHPSAAQWSSLSRERSNPEFSRLSALLSFDEAELLTDSLQVCRAAANVLIFDGAYVLTSSFTDGFDLLCACSRVSESVSPWM